MLAPSKATPLGPEPTAKVPSTAPSLARSLLTVLPLLFVTQMLAPSKATPWGPAPTAKGLPGWGAPSLARSLLTLLLLFATHMLAPSKAIAVGLAGTGKMPRNAPSPARRLLTLFLARFLFLTQIFAPS